ncbi:unnamed protein product [[Actinomadura] parvosata subsp. kistnae]|uniref:DUF6968 domain-containing protein n=1 Tax=[Actinomadura] parvosata subsp. kistnae TaxID=1909395 RepID=A0A1U9ZS79_9ACTN|nr:DUF2283 domain-containing protein [Nonomuraea sp. ATCC 55076]AQZ60791.1 hypothetical protein BKM31_04080 [Nonomuraea sp. ATCC 55076]SPL90576.1 unnamed protein product [Actinomadura parvosata subsp. kistnae]
MYEIAHRVLTLRTDPPREVVVTVGVPFEEPTGEWSCPYRIDGLDGWEHERKVSGLDSLEAVELAMVTVRAAVAGSHEAREGLLAWEEEPAGRRARTVYVSVDRARNLAYIAMKHEIVPGEAMRQFVAEDIVLDYGDAGQLLGLELTDAARLLPSELRL